MQLLITYDVATDDAAGARRLRRMAKACEAYGQRVQKSVFECTINPMQLEQFRHRAEQIIDESKDSLRIYRLPPTREQYLQVLGKPLAYDINEPLVL
jgi:CRISPR-associated protein Cas2